MTDKDMEFYLEDNLNLPFYPIPLEYGRYLQNTKYSQDFGFTLYNYNRTAMSKDISNLNLPAYFVYYTNESTSGCGFFIEADMVVHIVINTGLHNRSANYNFMQGTIGRVILDTLYSNNLAKQLQTKYPFYTKIAQTWEVHRDDDGLEAKIYIPIELYFPKYQEYLATIGWRANNNDVEHYSVKDPTVTVFPKDKGI